jgi:hypothetical protein
MDQQEGKGTAQCQGQRAVDVAQHCARHGIERQFQHPQTDPPNSNHHQRHGRRIASFTTPDFSDYSIFASFFVLFVLRFRFLFVLRSLFFVCA